MVIELKLYTIGKIPISMAKITLEGFRCERCKHEWVARGEEEPRVCPKCKSPYWNTPKKNKT